MTVLEKIEETLELCRYKILHTETIKGYTYFTIDCGIGVIIKVNTNFPLNEVFSSNKSMVSHFMWNVRMAEIEKHCNK